MDGWPVGFGVVAGVEAAIGLRPGTVREARAWEMLIRLGANNLVGARGFRQECGAA